MKASEINRWVIWLLVIWTKRLWEFEKLHVDIGLAAGPQIASTTNRFDNIQPQASGLRPSHASVLKKKNEQIKQSIFCQWSPVTRDSRYYNNSLAL
jgi:hypothetical protein